jgi:rubrerythrin
MKIDVTSIKPQKRGEIMKTLKMFGILGMVAALGLGFAMRLTAAEVVAKSTLDNLQAAYNGESNAKARYDAFAAKADAEGYKSVAALFRATSRSESIHAAKHPVAIKKLGAEPKAGIGKSDVKSTKENLEAALKGETYEKESMYPAFIKQADTDKNSGAVMSFKGALAAEVEHAKLFAQALKELDSWKEAGKEFYVCTVCGFTMSKILPKCPVCAAPKSKFDIIK